jgi:hypothetical protein
MLKKVDPDMCTPFPKTAYRALSIFAFIAMVVVMCAAQALKGSATKPQHLPYVFSNFVWWSNDELRGLVKSRIPGLGDEIAPGSPMEHKIHDVLTIILKQKGIVAEVQSTEPSTFALTAERVPGSPVPAIVYSILSPLILVDKVIVSDAPESVAVALNERLRQREGREYSGGQDWMVRSNVEDELEAKGYLDALIGFSHDSPRLSGDHYLVNLLLTIKSGPQFHIEAITADGGPLLRGRDLSSHFTEKPGDIAGTSPFGRLAGELRALYWHYGYADVNIQAPPVLDRTHSKVSYNLEVIPGPLYHLRSLRIRNLAPVQEQRARELLGMKAGDVFDGMAINNLYHMLPSDALLKADGFSFSPAKDKASAQVDLTLDFYKVRDKSSVTVQ